MKYSSSLMVAVCSAAIAIASAPSAMAAPAGNPSIDPLIRQAQFWKSRGRMDLALEAYKRVLAISPTDAEAKAAVAAIQAGQGAAPPPAPAPVNAPPAPEVKVAVDTPDHKTSRPPKKSVSDIAGQKRADGFKALNENDLGTAEADFRAALELRRDDSDSTGGLGVIYLRRGKFSEARDYLAKAARVSPAKWDEALKAATFYAQLKAGQAALDSGDLPTAERLAHALVDQGDDATLSATRLLANVLQAEDHPGEAAKLFNLVAEKLKGRADVSSLRINAVRAEAKQDVADGDIEAAKNLLQSAIVQDTQSPWLRHDYAELLLSEGRKDDALSVIAPIEADTAPDSIYAASLILVEADRTDEADKLLSKLSPSQMDPALRQLAIDVKVSEAISHAKLLSKDGRSAAALAELESLSAHTVESPSVLGDLALAFLDLRQTDKAAELALKGAQTDTAEPMSYASVVVALAKTGQDKAAADLLDRLVKRHGAPSSIGRLRALYASSAADRLRTEGQLATAYDLLQSAWAVAPGNDDLLGATARLYAAGHMYNQAGQVYEMILKSHPADTQSWLGLARVAAAANAKPMVKKALEHAVQSSPSDYATFVAASEISGQAGDRRDAVAYLEQARRLVNRENQLADGAAFPASNPFTNAALPGGGGGMAAPFNPFALPSGRSGGQMASSLNPNSLNAGNLDAGNVGADAQPPVQADMLAASGGSAASYDPSLIRRDSEIQAIDQQISALEDSSAPNVEAGVQVRSRTGQSGLSSLGEIQANVGFGGSIGDLKLAVTATPTVLEAGSIGSSALAFYGSNATLAAEGVGALKPPPLVGATLPNNAGVGVDVSATDGPVTATLGTTPLGFARVNALGSVAVTEKLTPSTTLTVGVDRKAVDDSITSYAGSRDPVTGKVWGAVTRNGVNASYGYDHDGVGLYVQANARVYQGVDVKSNTSGEFNAGGYLTPYKDDQSSLTVGVNVNFQGYANDQEFFTLGNGGYFSPKDFAVVSVPLNYRSSAGKFKFGLSVAPGYQTFDEAAGPIYPTSSSQQAVLDQLKAANNDVVAGYGSTSESRFGMTALLTGSYPITSSAMVDLNVSYDSFGPFQETIAGIQLKQMLGGNGK